MSENLPVPAIEETTPKFRPTVIACLYDPIRQQIYLTQTTRQREDGDEMTPVQGGLEINPDLKRSSSLSHINYPGTQDPFVISRARCLGAARELMEELRRRNPENGELELLTPNNFIITHVSEKPQAEILTSNNRIKRTDDNGIEYAGKAYYFVMVQFVGDPQYLEPAEDEQKKGTIGRWFSIRDPELKKRLKITQPEKQTSKGQMYAQMLRQVRQEILTYGRHLNPSPEVQTRLHNYTLLASRGGRT